VLAFLEGGGLGGPVGRVDTHGAVILLGRERAWKMKRAVRFSFMDLSTLDRREAAIRAELALNRSTAPELYRAVLPVTREADGRLALGGPGEPVEWLLEMRRFPAEDQLDRVAARGGLTPALVEGLARAIAAFHDAAEPRPDGGGADAMRAVVEGNAADLEGLSTVLPPDAVAALNVATAAELDRRAALLDARRAAGEVRRCHGDLHLANIVLLDGRPVLFDCLEFSEDLAAIDVLYDLAFLVMDLLERGLREPAWRLLQAYNDRRTGDAGLALMPLFLSVRAAVRAKIAGFTATGAGHADREAERRRALAYLDLARAALTPATPVLVAIGGRSGTGKSTLAAALAPRLEPMPGAVTLRSDIIRKRLHGREPTERLPGDAYGAAATARVYATIVERAAALLRAGRSVVADAVFGREAERSPLERLAAELGVRFRAVWLEAPDAVLEARVAARTGDASDAGVAVVRHQGAMGFTAPPGWRVLRSDRGAAALLDEIVTGWEG